MPSTTHLPRLAALSLRVLLLLYACTGLCSAGAQTPGTRADTVPLLLPGGVAFDDNGNLYLADTGKHVLLRVTPAGVLTKVAGTGAQGFDGDGGPATAALLDSPAGIVLDSGGNLYLADSHNHRIRRIDAKSGVITTFAGTGIPGSSRDGTGAATAEMDLPAALAFNAAGDLFFADRRAHLVRRIDHSSGQVTTVAGNGTQGGSGDGGPATAACVDAPEGLAVDAAGNLYLSDTHNQRVRRVDANTGVITTVAGSGQAGFSGDGGTAASASLRLPRGLALDASGNLLLVDSLNQRIRRVDASSGQISTVAGDGTQAFAGDLGPAVAASLNAPRDLTVSAAGLPTVSDSGNARVRQVDASAVIHTIAGLGAPETGILNLTGPSVTAYGTGSMTATLATSPATGSVTFFDGATRTLATAPLSANTAAFAMGSMPAGIHGLSATYTGDGNHPTAQSGVVSVTVAPALLTATPDSVSLLYGQSVPALTGALTGELAQDTTAGAVTLTLQSTAAAFSPPGSYPITASISGAAAANYTLSAAPAAVTIAKAPSVTTLTSTLAVHVAPSTAGTATGNVALLDGGQPIQTGTLSSTGDAMFAASSLVGATVSGATVSAGSHTLTAVYAGDGNLLSSTSAPVLITISPAAAPDFVLAATGPVAVTAPAATAAQFSFQVTPANGGLASPIQLTVSGVPLGATASFSPAYLPPGSAVQSFVLTVQTPPVARLATRDIAIYACLLPVLLLARRRRPALLIAGSVLLCAGLGCGARVNTTPAGATVPKTYNLTVIATGTSASGATVQHTIPVTLTVD